MTSWVASVAVLAADEPAPQQPGFGPLMLPMVLIGILWYFLLLRPQRKDQQRRDELLNQLKKNDRVVTIGGIIGTVAQVSDDKKKVTLKVDDNTKITFQRTAISSVLRDTEEPGAGAPGGAS